MDADLEIVVRTLEWFFRIRRQGDSVSQVRYRTEWDSLHASLASQTSLSIDSKGLQSRRQIAKPSFQHAKVVMERSFLVTCVNAQVEMISPVVRGDEIEASVVGRL